MSAYGFVCFFTDQKPCRPQEWVWNTMELFGAIPGETEFQVGKTIGILHEWNDFERLRDFGITAPYMEDPRGEWRTIQSDVLEVDPTIIETHDYEDSVLNISVYPAELRTRMNRIVEKEIPESIRGEYMGFRVGDLGFYIGDHDIFSSDELNKKTNEYGIYYGRAFYEFHLCGQGCPDNWEEFRRLVFEIPEIIELKEKIETFTGPLQTCAYWNV